MTAGLRSGPVAPTAGASGRLRPLPFRAARITGGLWAARQRVNREVAIPAGGKHLESAGNLDNLRIAAGTTSGAVRGPLFMDSDVYKWLEALAWEYGRDPSVELLSAQREVTAVVAAAQQPDGYLDSVVQLRDGGERYRNLPWSHEHYCAGHLFQAAVAQTRATGDLGLLDVAVRLADHLVATFGSGRRRDVDGHPVVEMALVELYRETGTPAYLELARFFVEARGHGLMAGYGQEPTYFSDRVPVREQSTVEGHAVRAVYLAAGAADVAAETGDAELLAALERQFAHMLATKTYLTGGLGARWDREAFGDPYELPPDRAYAESCAAVGGVQWAWRMLLGTGHPRYADAAERMLLNALLPGVSLGGSDYFYVNPLQLRADAHADDGRSPAHGRRGWFECACCPANIMRTLASLSGYLATTDAEGIQLHQYAPATVEVGDTRLALETDYPWDGLVRVRVERAPAADRDAVSPGAGLGRRRDPDGRRRAAGRRRGDLRVRPAALAGRRRRRVGAADAGTVHGGGRAHRRGPWLPGDRARTAGLRRGSGGPVGRCAGGRTAAGSHGPDPGRAPSRSPWRRDRRACRWPARRRPGPGRAVPGLGHRLAGGRGAGGPTRRSAVLRLGQPGNRP